MEVFSVKEIVFKNPTNILLKIDLSEGTVKGLIKQLKSRYFDSGDIISHLQTVQRTGEPHVPTEEYLLIDLDDLERSRRAKDELRRAYQAHVDVSHLLHAVLDVEPTWVKRENHVVLACFIYKQDRRKSEQVIGLIKALSHIYEELTVRQMDEHTILAQIKGPLLSNMKKLEDDLRGLIDVELLR